MKLDTENFIDIKKELPPFDVFVKVKGNDFMGDFYCDILYARKQYRLPRKKGKPIGWRWVDKDGNRCGISKDIDGWKYDQNT